MIEITTEGKFEIWLPTGGQMSKKMGGVRKENRDASDITKPTTNTRDSAHGPTAPVAAR